MSSSNFNDVERTKPEFIPPLINGKPITEPPKEEDFKKIWEKIIKLPKNPENYRFS